MNHGILPTRGSLMLDVVFLAMFVVVAALAISIYLVKVRRLYRVHKRIQMATAAALLLVIVGFEIEVRFFTDWKKLAEPSPLYSTGWVNAVLLVHLCFAIPTPFFWIIAIVGALRNFSPDPKPNPYSRKHKRLAWTAAVMMFTTALTGCTFYVVAFVL